MKDVLFGKDAHERMKKGRDKIYEAVGSTIGPKGRNIFIDDAVNPRFTNDGVTIAHNTTFPDKFENMGAWVYRNASAQTNDDAGDGTTTTVVVLHELIEEAQRRPENPTTIMQSLLAAKPKVIEALKKASVEATDILSVARISAENEDLAKLVSEVVKKVGPKSVVTVEDRRDGFTSDYNIVQGYEAHVGFMSPYFRNDPNKPRAVHDNIHVLCSALKFGTVSDLKMFEQFADTGINSLVVVAEDIEPSILGVFVATKLSSKMNLLVIRATGPLLEDIAHATGATLIGPDTGVTFENFDSKKHLGKARKVVCEEKKTLFLSDAKTALTHAERLEALADSNPNQFEAKKARERAAKLRGGVAVIRIGAHTDAERNYLKDKAEDTIRSAQAAMEEGVVEGGGMALYRIASAMKPKTVGEEILQRALTAPLRKIVENAGKDYAGVIKDMPEGMGYDAKNDQYVDMHKSGILDPVKVERCVVENAVSTAAYFITTHGAITEYVEQKD